MATAAWPRAGPWEVVRACQGSASDQGAAVVKQKHQAQPSPYKFRGASSDPEALYPGICVGPGGGGFDAKAPKARFAV
jgi:hypothetical protein